MWVSLSLPPDKEFLNVTESMLGKPVFWDWHQEGTSCSPPTLRRSSPAETDGWVGRAILHEVKASQDPQPSPVVGAATLLRDLLQPSSFRNDPIWVDAMLSSVQRACFHYAVWIWPYSVRDTMFCINASWKLQAENWPRSPIWTLVLAFCFSRTWAMPLWPSYFTFLSLSFPICKMKRLLTSEFKLFLIFCSGMKSQVPFLQSVILLWPQIREMRIELSVLISPPLRACMHTHPPLRLSSETVFI